MNITDVLHNLVANRTIDPELYDTVTALAEDNQRNNLASGRPVSDLDSPTDQADEFMVALAGEEISGLITKESDLSREFRRWLVRRNSPEMAELWTVISEALLTLEKEGAVCRSEGMRKFNNSNATEWFLPGCADCSTVDPRSADRLAARLPALSAKGKHDRVLNPTEARAAVMAVLETLGGPVAMAELVKSLAAHLPLLRIERLHHTSREGDEENSSFDSHIEAQPLLTDYQMIIDEETESAVRQIWEQAGTLRRGSEPSKLDGRRILCCYLLPKTMYQAKVKLDQFGATSTVQDVVNRLRAILKHSLPVPGSDRLQQWLATEITRTILAALIDLCSENGLCRAFYESRT